MSISTLARSLAFVLSLLPALASAQPVLQIPPYAENFDLSTVEALYKSAAYKVEVRPVNTADYSRVFVFETRNDWVLRNYKGKQPFRVIRAADQYGGDKGEVRTASFAPFSFANTAVEVRVTLLSPQARADSVAIRPLRHAISATIAPDGKSFTFTLDKPLKVSVEVNDRFNPLFLFTDNPDVPNTAATYYFGPGVHRIPGDNGTLTVSPGQSVYIAAGAVVEGRIVIEPNSSNVRITGRGLLSRGEWPHLTWAVPWLIDNAMIYSRGTDHLLLEGITLVQSSGWTVAIEDLSGHSTHDNFYSNVKHVHWAGNSDAFWLTGDNNRLDDCFVFNNDDAIVTKGGSGTRVSNLVVWGGVWGRLALLFNFGRPITDVIVENVDLIHKAGSPQVIKAEKLRRSPPTELSNITFRNIRIENRHPADPENKATDQRSKVVFIQIDANLDAMKVSGLHFENITLDQHFPDEGRIIGTNAVGLTGITFTNLRMGGKLITTAEESHIRFNPHVTDVTFVGTSANPADPSTVKP